MSLRVKLVSAFAMMFLMIGILIVGIFAAQQQTLTMTGNVQFNINDRSLYVKQVRIKQDNSSAEPQVVSDFMPGYINGEFNMNIGEYDNSLGSFALYFDIINATDDEWEITKVTLSEQLQSEQVSVTYSGIIETNDIAEKDDNGYKIFDPETTDIDGSLILVVTAPNSSSIDLSGITITLNVYIPPVLEGFTFDNNGTLVLYTGSDTEVVIPSSYSIIEGESVDKTLEFSSYEDFEADAMANMNAYMSMTNITVIVDGYQYGPYDNFTEFSTKGDAVTAMETATSIIFNYQESGDQYVKGNDYQVTTIGMGAFSYNTNITEVILPSSLTSIGGSAFGGCSGLTTVNLSSCTNLTSIGGAAFSGCSGLTELDLSNCTSLISIEANAFYGCSGLTNISLPSSLTSIGGRAFSNCSGLTELDLSQCTSLISIGSYAFWGCSGLTELDLSQCTSLISIGDYAFRYCSGLTEVDLSQCTNLTSIGGAAFSGCSGLTELDLSNCTSLISIEANAFYGCSGLTNISLPSSLTSIGQSAFFGCDALTTIRIEATTPPTIDGSTIPSTIATIEVPSASVDAYKSGWSSYADKIVGY